MNTRTRFQQQLAAREEAARIAAAQRLAARTKEEQAKVADNIDPKDEALFTILTNDALAYAAENKDQEIDAWNKVKKLAEYKAQKLAAKSEVDTKLASKLEAYKQFSAQNEAAE